MKCQLYDRENNRYFYNWYNLTSTITQQLGLESHFLKENWGLKILGGFYRF